MPYMYILKCADNSFYTVSTVNLEKRLWEHQNGLGANYTKKRLPVKLVFCEAFSRVDEAFFRENQVQGWSRAKKQALIDGRYEDLPDLALNSSAKTLVMASSAQESLDTPSTGSGNVVLTEHIALAAPTPLAEPVEAQPVAQPQPSPKQNP
ncbi:MAG: GIY-YIG nuclease family protein [Methylotenera sp.]|nr:GIY-YIG nuclease family protein [Methylotenera sp.]